MGKHVGKPIIIEFMGTPGCGKTTTSRVLQALLSQSGYYCYRYFYKNGLYKNKFFQLFHPSNLIVLYKLARLAAKQIAFRDSYPGILAICNCLLMYNSFSHYCCNGSDVLIIDQGIMQGFLSISHKNRIYSIEKVDDLLKYIKKDAYNYIVVYCDIPPSISIERLKNRKRQNGRLDGMDDANMMGAIHNQSDNCSELLKLLKNRSFNVIQLNMKNDVNENANQIFGKL